MNVGNIVSDLEKLGYTVKRLDAISGEIVLELSPPKKAEVLRCPVNSVDVDDKLVDILLETKSFISGINAYREMTKPDLLTAKEYVEKLVINRNLGYYNNIGFLVIY